jgi:hypothetical protein
MNLLVSGATMTTAMAYPDIAAAATGAARDLLSGDVLIYARWPSDPVRRIVALERTLGHNWDAYGSPRITRKTANLAIALVNQIAALGFDELPAPSVSPISGGGVILEWTLGGRDLSFSVFPELTIEYLKSGAGEPFEEGPVSPGFPGRLRELVSWLMAAPLAPAA